MVKIFRPPSAPADDYRYAVVLDGVVEMNEGNNCWSAQEVPEGWVEMVPGQAPPMPILARNLGTHQTHCCAKHGCSYGAIDCPVEKGTMPPHYPNNNGCEACEFEAQDDGEPDNEGFGL